MKKYEYSTVVAAQGLSGSPAVLGIDSSSLEKIKRLKERSATNSCTRTGCK